METRTNKYTQLKNKFEKSKREGVGDYITLCEVIVGRGYSKLILRKAFKNLIRDYYDISERQEYINYLYTI